MLSYYRILDPMPPGPKRDSVLREMRATVPANELAARRLFIGRNTEKASQITLSDRQGRARLRLLVDSLGAARIEFLDTIGAVVKTVLP